MSLQVLDGSRERDRVVTEAPKPLVALVAEQPAHLPGGMTVVDVELTPATTRTATAEKAAAVLLALHSPVVGYGDPVVPASTEEPTLRGSRVALRTAHFAKSSVWSWRAPTVPESVCPLNFTSNVLTACDWEAIMDPIAVQYPLGATVAEFICHATRCPAGAIPGAGTVVVHIGDGGAHSILPQCNSGDTRICFTQARVSGNLRIQVFNMKAGDPRIAGRCVAGC